MLLFITELEGSRLCSLLEQERAPGRAKFTASKMGLYKRLATAILALSLAAVLFIFVLGSVAMNTGSVRPLRHFDAETALFAETDTASHTPTTSEPLCRNCHTKKGPRAIAGFSLTGEEGPSVGELQRQLVRCSLAMGMSWETLESRAAIVNTISANLSLFLSAVRSIVPREFSRSYSSPCWETALPPLTEAQRKGVVSLLEAGHSHQMRPKTRLHTEILGAALNRTRKKLRCLPAFFLAGFPKSGTTTLHKALYRHPAILKPVEKEPHWWTRAPLGDGDQDYLRLAVVRYLLFFRGEEVRRQPRQLLYDGSQSMLWDSNFSASGGQDYCAMPAAVSSVLPSAKFIVVMREPVSRTYSHYIYSCTWRGRRPAGPALFHRQAVADLKHLHSCLANSSLFECAADPRFSAPSSHKRPCGSLGYRLLVSIYRFQLDKWLQFYPRDNFLLLRLEDLSRDPHVFMRRVTKFLGVADIRPAASRWLRTHRENQQARHRPMLPQTRALLSEFFRPFNEKLVELTGDKRFLWTDIH